MKPFLRRKPFLSSVLLILVFFLFASIAALVLSLVFDIPFFDPRIQNGARAFGAVTLVLLAALTRVVDLSFLRSFGNWKMWLLVGGLAVYSFFTGNYAYFGEMGFPFSEYLRSDAARQILVTQVFVSFSEEILFRGMVLSVLLAGWGRDRKGLLRSVLISALLFSIPHLLHLMNVSNRNDLLIVLINAVYCFVSGLSLALLVINTRSLYPALLLHFLGNAAIQIKGMYTPMLGPLSSYIRLMLVELVIVVALLLLVLRDLEQE